MNTPLLAGDPHDVALKLTGPAAGTEGGSPASSRSLRSLDWLNFFLADVQTGLGPFLAIYLAGYGWNEQGVGLALTVGGIAGIVTQTPIGWLIDRIRAKQALIAVGVVALAAGALLIALWPSFWVILAAQTLIGGTSSIFIPAVCAVSLGLVGHAYLDARQGRNQAFNSAGNVAAALAIGVTGYLVSNRSVFFLIILLALPTLIMVFSIRSEEIDFERARGAGKDAGQTTPASVLDLLRDRPLVIFLACAVMFHFSNAAMLPLLGERLASGQGPRAMLFMSACVVTTQVVVVLLAAWTGKKAGTWGRKPLLLIAFGVLPIRGLLYTFTDVPSLLVAIQILDGVAAAIFGVVSVLVIADLTRGSSRFNLTLGVITTAVGIGASLSQYIAGAIVHHYSFRIGMFFLAGIALLGFAVLYLFMPETRDKKFCRNQP